VAAELALAEPVVARTVFTAGDTDYTWGDVVVAARLRGDWALAERDARAGLGALQDLEARGEEVGQDELGEAGVAFRYERDLLSGDEMEAWLARWDLSTVEWSEWIGRVLARGRVPDSPSAELDDDGVETATGVEAICSGSLERWARDLAERTAVSLASGERAAPAPASEPPPARGVLALDPVEWHASAAKVAPLDIPVEELVEAGGGELARELSLHKLDWLTFDCRSVRLRTPSSAREATMCLRSDGLTLESVANRARVPLGRLELVLEDAAARLQPALAAALPGDVLGPVEDDDGFLVLVVDDKRAPSAADPALAQRARARAVERALRRTVDGCVRWHERV
jgi:hypothetical protein